MISLCMIVKNEAELLPRALADWRALADELVIVDTGSTDGTMGVAWGLGATVVSYKWQPPGHKGEARNRAIDAASGDWVVMLDADEIIQRPAGLRSFLLGKEAEGHTAFNVQFQNFDDAGRVVLQWQQIRIFRRGLYRYHHREHELPYPNKPEDAREGSISVIFEHRPPADRAAAKHEPMIARLELDCREHPGDPHPLYFLHRQYVSAGRYGQGIQAGREYLSLAKHHGLDQAECYGNLAIAHQARGEMQEAINCLYLAAALQPERRVWWIRLAEIYHGQGQNNIALALLRCAAELWPTSEANGLPHTNGAHLYEFIRHCQQAIAEGDHHG